MRKDNIPDDNPVDLKLVELQNANILSKSTWDKLEPQYWQILVDHLTIHDLEYILSFEQKGNWNKILYRTAKNRLSTLCVEDILLGTSDNG